MRSYWWKPLKTRWTVIYVRYSCLKKKIRLQSNCKYDSWWMIRWHPVENCQILNHAMHQAQYNCTSLSELYEILKHNISSFSSELWQCTVHKILIKKEVTIQESKQVKIFSKDFSKHFIPSESGILTNILVYDFCEAFWVSAHFEIKHTVQYLSFQIRIDWKEHTIAKILSQLSSQTIKKVKNAKILLLWEATSQRRKERY